MMLLDQGGGHHAAVVVVLGHHRGEACGRQVPEQFEMVDGAWCNGWATVNMRVDSTFQKAIDALLDGNGFARLLSIALSRELNACTDMRVTLARARDSRRR